MAVLRAHGGHDSTIYAAIAEMIEVREYCDPGGQSPFGVWFDKLTADAAAKVTTALYRLGPGNFSNVKAVGTGVHEYKINFGPGYRVYFGQDGEHIIILLGGGTKQRQQNDISVAMERWKDYKRTKKRQKAKGEK